MRNTARLAAPAVAVALLAAAGSFATRIPMAIAQEPRASSTTADAPAWWKASMETHDQRIAWWREARFGMFIHWGVYSELGGEWQGKQYKGYAEHLQRMARIPIPVYRKEVAG